MQQNVVSVLRMFLKKDREGNSEKRKKSLQTSIRRENKIGMSKVVALPIAQKL